MKISPRFVGAGAFIAVGVLAFTTALFMIGDRRMLFEQRYPVVTEFADLGELQPGAVVRVAGLDAGEVTDIQIPRSPAEKFRVEMSVREDIRQLIRTDSVASTQTEGLVGAIFVNITPGSADAPAVAEGGTIPGREPQSIAALLTQASDAVTLITTTVESLRGDAEKAVKNIALTAEAANALVEQVGPDFQAMAANGARISADTRQIMASINSGQGTIGKLVHDDSLYVEVREITTQAREIAAQTRTVMTNVEQVTAEARRAIVDFRSSDGPAQGLMADMRITLAQAREATGDLADNMEALKHNFFLRGFFNRRGYFDLDAISPADYRKGVLEQGRRKAMRIWLADRVLFERAPNGVAVLTADGRARLDSAMATYLKYVPSNPIVVEGYATVGSAGERFQLARARAVLVREYLLGQYGLMPQNTGYIALGNEAPGSPAGEQWDGVAITLFLDRNALQFVTQPARN